jgi:hypothetical protein
MTCCLNLYLQNTYIILIQRFQNKCHNITTELLFTYYICLTNYFDSFPMWLMSLEEAYALQPSKVCQWDKYCSHSKLNWVQYSELSQKIICHVNFVLIYFLQFKNSTFSNTSVKRIQCTWCGYEVPGVIYGNI